MKRLREEEEEEEEYVGKQGREERVVEEEEDGDGAFGTWAEKRAFATRAPPTWTCTLCESVVDDVHLLLACPVCNTPRFEEQAFGGDGFFVTRTRVDAANDCSSLNRIVFAQLLVPPATGGVLLACLVSGLVTSESQLIKWVRANVPTTARLWAVVHRQGGADHQETQHSASLAGQPLWRAVQWRPKAIGSMHAKLYLFRFSHILRVVVTSANPCSASWDWQREVLWAQDFPVVASAPRTAWGDYLVSFLCHMRVSDAAQRCFGVMDCVDFSAAAGPLVASVPGKWLRDTSSAAPFGHLRLRHVVRELGWRTHWNDDACTLIQTGSLGTSLQMDVFFADFFESVCGEPHLARPCVVDDDSHEGRICLLFLFVLFPFVSPPLEMLSWPLRATHVTCASSFLLRVSRAKTRRCICSACTSPTRVS